jgi:LytTr DNA-binding domain
MMLNQKLSYNSIFISHLIVAILLGFILSFLVIFLEPFDTDEFNHPNKTVLLAGYGFLLSTIYIVIHFFERLFFKKQKYWTYSNEIAFQSIFYVLVISSCFLYNQIVINQIKIVSIKVIDGLNFLFYVGFPLIPFILLPSILIRRYISMSSNFDVRSNKNYINGSHLITIKGQNKNDAFTINFDEIFYANVLENYVQIHFLKNDILEKKLVRNTLNKIHSQIPNLLQCHRSYLINPSKIIDLKGNTQKAFLILHDIDFEIPVSKKYYKSFKERL